MKNTILANILKLTDGHRARNRTAALLASLALAAAHGSAKVIDDFNGPPKWSGENDPSGLVTNVVVDQQLQFTADFKTATSPENPLNTFGNVYYLTNLPVRQRQTLELRADLVRANQDNVFAHLGTMNASGGEYMLAKDQNEIALIKYSAADGFSVAFWESRQVKNQDVVLVLTLTPIGERLLVGTKVLDKGNQQVLFERTVVDGPGSDWVVPDPAPHGWKIFTPDAGRPYSDDLTVAWLAIHHVTDGQQGPAELRLDNLEYDIYDSPYLGIEKAVCLLPWPENTAEEQIVVGAASLAGPWAPWPEPIFKRQGQLCMAVPTPSAQQFFKLVPGTQFSDDFSGEKQPWEPYFYASADASRWTFTNTNRVLRIQPQTSPTDGRVILIPPGPDVVVRDFWASVDILDWDPNTLDQWFAIASRGWRDPATFPGTSNGYLGGIALNADGRKGKARLQFWTGYTAHPGPLFDLKPDTDYRLCFSAVGKQLSLQFLDLNLQQTVSTVPLTDSTWSQGFVCLWVENATRSYAVTVDNFFVTGTKP